MFIWHLVEDILQFLNFVQVEQLQIKFVPSMDMTKLYSFVTHHSCCSLAYSIKISLVHKINTLLILTQLHHSY